MIQDRSKAARTIARRVTDRVRNVAPPGLGRWDGAWELVEDPSLAFLDSLARWEAAEGASPTAEEALRGEVREAANRLVLAWAEAARRWEAAGCPDSCEARELSRA